MKNQDIRIKNQDRTHMKKDNMKRHTTKFICPLLCLDFCVLPLDSCLLILVTGGLFPFYRQSGRNNRGGLPLSGFRR